MFDFPEQASDQTKNASTRDSASKIRDEVRQSLSAAPPWLSSRFFYDARGAQLFEQICTLPEYYPTRCELEILQQYLPAMTTYLGPGCEVVEPGSGEGIKTQRLLQALEQPSVYRPIDVAEDQLQRAAAGLSKQFPKLQVQPVCGDFTQDLVLPALSSAKRRVFYFPGSTIGNFLPEEAQELLRCWRNQAGAHGMLLIGVDLRKNAEQLQAAYDDSTGVTAEFNRNILRHLNAIIGSDFQPTDWQHEAPYDEASGQVQMWLRAVSAQQVSLGSGPSLEFAAGDAIRTEYSCKYDVDEFQELASGAGWQAVDVWFDSQRWFSVQLFRAA